MQMRAFFSVGQVHAKSADPELPEKSDFKQIPLEV